MVHITINDKTTEGKKLVAFLKTQPYIKIYVEPNAETKLAIKEVEDGKVTRAKNPEDFLSKFLDDMYELYFSNHFQKDLNLLKKRGYNIELFYAVSMQLYKTGKLDAQYRTHKLQGKFKNYLECHIKSDWLLIWKQDEKAKKIIFTRTGTHADLF